MSPYLGDLRLLTSFSCTGKCKARSANRFCLRREQRLLTMTADLTSSGRSTARGRVHLQRINGGRWWEMRKQTTELRSQRHLWIWHRWRLLLLVSVIRDFILSEVRDNRQCDSQGEGLTNQVTARGRALLIKGQPGVARTSQVTARRRGLLIKWLPGGGAY